MFSTIYTMWFYWNAVDTTGIQVTALTEYDGTSITDPDESQGFFTDMLSSVTDYIFEALSWFSPFAIIKGIMILVVPAAIYEPLNLILLRPMGWIGTWITTEWIINKIRGSSE